MFIFTIINYFKEILLTNSIKFMKYIELLKWIIVITVLEIFEKYKGEYKLKRIATSFAYIYTLSPPV